MINNKINATACILIGGKSERFGSPKWQAKIDGMTVLDIIWNTIEPFQKRIIIGKEKPHNFNKPFIRDKLKINAPINGLYTAIEKIQTDWIFLLSCDLPLLNYPVIETLWNFTTESSDAVIPITNKKKQVTSGFYHKRILPTLQLEIRNENFSLYKLLEKLNSTIVQFDNDKRFWNMNTEKDFKKIKKIYAP